MLVLDSISSIQIDRNDSYVWKVLLDRALNSPTNPLVTFYEGIDFLGISSNRIPETSELNEHLQKINWSALDVTRSILPSEFFTLLSNRTIPISKNIRSFNELDFSSSPDRFHDVIGHLPLLIDKDYRTFMENFGTIASKLIWSENQDNSYKAAVLNNTISADYDSKLNFHDTRSLSLKLERLFWWTVEFGLIESGGVRVAGAALLSSSGETKRILSSTFNKIELSEQVFVTPYSPTEQQQIVFVSKGFNDWISLLEVF